MKQFNVIWYNCNKKDFEPYDIMPYLVDEYKKSKKKLKTFEEFKEFVNSTSMYQWWSRCEYEIILSDWPPSGIEKKWDIYKQILMNINLITSLLMESV